MALAHLCQGRGWEVAYRRLGYPLVEEVPVKLHTFGQAAFLNVCEHTIKEGRQPGVVVKIFRTPSVHALGQCGQIDVIQRDQFPLGMRFLAILLSRSLMRY